MTRVGEKQKQIAARFAAAGLDSPAQQARLVLENVLKIEPLTLPFVRDDAMDKEDEARAERMTCALVSGQPLAYVLSSQPFLDLSLYVAPGVLIPRPETEELALWAIDALKQKPDAHVLDLCTGSGALALAIKHACPQARVVGSDLSDDALKIAEENARRLQLDVTFQKSDLFSELDGTFDLIVSNPPYIRTADCAHLAPNVRDHEPMMALDGGSDGLDFYRAIAKEAPRHLNAGGCLFFEVGFDQARQVAELLENDFNDVTVRRDMEGIARMVMGRKKGGVR